MPLLSLLPKTTVAKDCGGDNVSPELHWSAAPKGTKSFALIVHDPDAPIPGGYYHWAVATIPPSTMSLTLYALDETMHNAGALTAKQLLARIKGHILAQTTLTGLYETTANGK